jgi:glycerophosphoryl diester phosphodiesterase
MRQLVSWFSRPFDSTELSMSRTRFPAATAWIAQTPIAHRGLHDMSAGRFENTLSAARAAVAKGFAIEVDLHPSSDGVPMVFHDLTLDRLTSEKGSVRERTAAELGAIAIGGTADMIPTLSQLLEVVDGKVGLVLELKGLHGEDDGFVEAIARELLHYAGPVAMMSFNHWLVEDMRKFANGRPVGLTAEGDDRLREVHWGIARQTVVDFVSYGISDLPCRFVDEFRAGGKPVISWTIRNRDLMEKSMRHADQITFEGFDPRSA